MIANLHTLESSQNVIFQRFWWNRFSVDNLEGVACRYALCWHPPSVHIAVAVFALRASEGMGKVARMAALWV